MTKRFDIVQGTIEWHEAKWRKIGGTLSKGLFVDSQTLYLDILSQHLEDFEDEDNGFESPAMKRGSQFESFAREYIEQYTGLKFEVPGLLESEDNILLVISPDGITSCDRFGVEIKCPGRKQHTKILLAQKTPDEYIPQIVHNFTVNPKLEKFWFISYRPESKIAAFIEEFTRDSIVDFKWTIKTEIPQFSKKDGTTPIASKFETSADVKPISEWVKIAHEKAGEMLSDLKIDLIHFNNQF